MDSERGLNAELLTRERCHILELYNREQDDTCSVARARVEPGVSTQLHLLKGTIERYVILEGEGRVEVGGGPPWAVGELDIVEIQPEVPQKITNTGTGDLVFLCICTPRFKPENYVCLET